jgi:hypothetical protein
MALTKLSSTEFQTGAITTDKFSGDVALSVRIANVLIANSTYTVLDDTAVNVGGGYIVVTGAGFQSGAQIVINETPATSTTFVSSTELRAQIGAKSAATYDVYVINPDGGNAISVNGITYSGLPTWVTGSTLDAQNADVAFNVLFSATGATSYANTTALPAGTVLLSNGYFYGTVTGIGSETTYNFTISAIDDENQNSDREFSLTVAVVTAPSTVEYLVVAGGGAGAYDYGGGGGAGGFLTGNLSITTTTSYTVTIGSGGTAGSTSSSTNGQNSTFASITSTGGGKGGYRAAGSNGGSGGGGGEGPNSGGNGTPGQGNNGGNGWPSFNSAGGGGGAGAIGQDAPSINQGGAGGNGSTAFDGIVYAGGGGGGNYNTSTSGGAGGTGGGGKGGGGSIAGFAGTTNTGGGGGGGGAAQLGGNGGSGIVIVRYPNNYDDAVSTTGSPTFTNTGGYKIYKFTGSGSITW